MVKSFLLTNGPVLPVGRRFSKLAVVGGESTAQGNLIDGGGEIVVGQEKG